MRKFIFASALLLSSSFLFAQDGPEFMHSLGGKFYFYPKSDGMYSSTILYSPRLNVSIGENHSISVGTHLSLGFSLQSGAMGNERSFVFDLPLVGEFNFGAGSSKENESGFGGYVGAGYGLHRISMATDYGSGSVTLHGPVFTGGIRFAVGSTSLFEVGGSYMLDLKSKEDKINVPGISVSYFLGMGGGRY